MRGSGPVLALVILLLGCCLAQERPRPDIEKPRLTVLVLQTGESLTGHVLNETAAAVLFRQKDGTQVSVPVDQIKERTSVPVIVSRPAAVPIGGGALKAGLLSGVFVHRSRGNRRRLLAAEGGDRATEAAVAAALAWLARHQEADGHWDAKKHHAAEKTDTACTGLALLAFLAAGHSEKVGTYQKVVRRAVQWLKSRQKDDEDAAGLVFESTDAGGHRGVGYPHAIAGTALVEAAGMARVPETLAAARKAVDYSTGIHQHGERKQKGGFRYKAQHMGDLSVTGWYMLQLRAAKVVGLDVDQDSLDGISRFLDSCERTAGDSKEASATASAYSYMPRHPHEHTAHCLTAIGNLCRHFLGTKKKDLQSSVEWFVKKGGVPDQRAMPGPYYWYFGTLCTFQQGGEVWKKWNAAMKRTLCDTQRHGGDEDGSWDVRGKYAHEWGRVGQTAICCLCLEVYYRYQRVSK